MWMKMELSQCFNETARQKILKHPQLFCLLPLKFFIIPDNEIPILKKQVTHIDNTKITANSVIYIWLSKSDIFEESNLQRHKSLPQN